MEILNYSAYLRYMYFTQKIYINNKPLILTNSSSEYRALNPYSKGYYLFVGAFARNFRLAKKQLENPMSTGVILEDIDIDVIQKELNSYFKNVVAAGGIVRNPAGDVLMIFRRGKWDLPKGKLDEGETIIDCAIREIIEETGLPEVSAGNYLGVTYHIYSENKKDIIKTTHWYDMCVKKDYKLVPQAEENILEAKWIPVERLNDYLKLTYEGIKDVFKMANLI